MAGNTVTLTFAGDSSSLEKSFQSVGTKAVSMAGDFDKAETKSKSFSGAMDRAGESAGGAEGKFMGTADLLDGLGGAFGLPTEKATGLFRAFGDLSGGFEVLQPMIGSLGTMFTGLGTTLITPPVGVILLIGALVAALILAYQHSETFRNIVKGAFDTVKGAAETMWNFIGSLPEKILGIGETIKDAVLWPYKTAFNLIAKAWNSTVGTLSFEIPSWVPLGLGGKGFSMPKLPEFHTGGVVPGAPGTAVPIMAMAGETVTPAGGGATTVIQLVLDGRVLTEVVHDGLLAKQRRTPLGLAT